ncbi:predicted protein [Plenodomus lingam JN3]|uniref:Predicted protein n=1 Tax=Leptosphaeria maculans (strain JN3 / isolate v23.1.3 / race Av1-4-5-6-7-8) TaxID=985895 RepID=E4ZPW5_LEPMJ|nr:predicted protein [Plenodomus lingam JN3]CBX93500.1 predicted protein [Plenodomus lingam JN3]
MVTMFATLIITMTVNLSTQHHAVHNIHRKIRTRWEIQSYTLFLCVGSFTPWRGGI